MKPIRLLTFALAGCATMALTAQTQPPAAPQQPPRQPTEIELVINGAPGLPPKIAVPDFIPLSSEPETIAAAKTVGEVLWDDLNFEREFYLIPRDTYRSIPAATSTEQVALDRWKEIGADGVVVGSIRKGPSGYVVEVRLLQVVGGRVAIGKQYSGSLNSVKDGGRIYAHTAADRPRHHRPRVPAGARLQEGDAGEDPHRRRRRLLEQRARRPAAPVPAPGADDGRASSRAAHIPAQIGSRCSSAPLTSAGVEDRDCNTMLIMCAVRSAEGRWTTAPPTLPRRTEIRPSVSRMWIASRSAGGLTPNSENRLSCDGSTSPSLSRPDRMSSRSREATISATRGWRMRCTTTSS